MRTVQYDVADGLNNADGEIDTPAANHVKKVLSNIMDIPTITANDGTWAQPDVLYYYFLEGLKYNVYEDLPVNVVFDTNNTIQIQVRPLVRRNS